MEKHGQRMNLFCSFQSTQRKVVSVDDAKVLKAEATEAYDRAKFLLNVVNDILTRVEGDKKCADYIKQKLLDKEKGGEKV